METFFTNPLVYIILVLAIGFTVCQLLPESRVAFMRL